MKQLKVASLLKSLGPIGGQSPEPTILQFSVSELTKCTASQPILISLAPKQIQILCLPSRRLRSSVALKSDQDKATQGKVHQDKVHIVLFSLGVQSSRKANSLLSSLNSDHLLSHLPRLSH